LLFSLFRLYQFLHFYFAINNYACIDISKFIGELRDPLSKNSLATIQSWEMLLAETIHTFLFLRYDIVAWADGKKSKETEFLTAKGIIPKLPQLQLLILCITTFTHLVLHSLKKIHIRFFMDKGGQNL